MKKQSIYLGVASVLGVIALAFSQQACWFWSYQPKDPKCINK